MSGGSYDYLFGRIQDAAHQVTRTRNTPERRAFADLLTRVAKAMHAIEWVDSSDYGPGDENEPIRAALGPNADAAILRAAIEDAEQALATLDATLAAARKVTVTP